MAYCYCKRAQVPPTPVTIANAILLDVVSHR
jgi:hypothetical protein